jgi:hypothetical protein
MAVVAPPGPLPTMMALLIAATPAAAGGREQLEQGLHDPVHHGRVGTVRRADLHVAPADRLHVAGELDLLPTDETDVAAVLRDRVGPLDGMGEQDVAEVHGAVLHQRRVLRGPWRAGEVAPGQAVEEEHAIAVGLLELRDPRPPGLLLDAGEGHERRHAVGLARVVPVAERPAGMDRW